MADRALGFMTPLPVAVQTLTVIGSLQPRLGKIFAAGVAVTFPTRKDFVRWVKMVTQCAAATHLGHLGVKFVREYHRDVLRRKLIHQDYFRSAPGCKARACNQTRVFLGRTGTGVAV